MPSSKILIVGPNGYLASHLLPLLTDDTLIGLGALEEAAPGVQEYFTNPALLKQAHLEFNTIYLLGSFIPYGSYHVPNSEFVKSNIALVATLSTLFPDARIVFSSSISIFGNPVQLPITLTSPFNNPDLYGMSKLAGEAIIRNHKSYGILRFTSIIGPGMRAQTMIPKMVTASKAGKIMVWGDGTRRQNYIDVRDAAEMCLHAGQASENLTAFGAGSESHSNREAALLIQTLTGAEIEFTGEDSAPSFVYSTEESYRVLNFSPRYSLRETLNDMIAGQ